MGAAAFGGARMVRTPWVVRQANKGDATEECAVYVCGTMWHLATDHMVGDRLVYISPKFPPLRQAPICEDAKD